MLEALGLRESHLFAIHQGYQEVISEGDAQVINWMKSSISSHKEVHIVVEDAAQ